MPTNVIDAVDEVNGPVNGCPVRHRDSVGGSGEDSDDGGHSDVEEMQNTILGEMAAGFEEIFNCWQSLGLEGSQVRSSNPQSRGAR